MNKTERIKERGVFIICCFGCGKLLFHWELFTYCESHAISNVEINKICHKIVSMLFLIILVAH